MLFLHPTQYATGKEVWLRRNRSPSPSGQWHSVSLTELGVAAARETFSTRMPPFEAAWIDLFQNMVTVEPKLQWRDNGPGVGRDARIAYSGLFGRYMARTYLTTNENVRVLVPLDEAKRSLQGTSYSIEKNPPGYGLEADWVGLDGGGRLVIVEAKGSFDTGIKRWSGPGGIIPDILDTGIGQVRRTAVFKNRKYPLSAKRWAVASRWSNEDNKRTPTLLAWDVDKKAVDEKALDNNDYRTLKELFHRTDVEGILSGLGHIEVVEAMDAPDQNLPGGLALRVGNHRIEPGFAAVLGPIGIHPLHSENDLDLVRVIREFTPNIVLVLVSLSRQYVNTIIQEPQEFGEEIVRGGDGRFAQHAGLTIAWPMPDEDIVLGDSDTGRNLDHPGRA